MSEENQDMGGAQENVGGASEPKTEVKVVDYSDHKRALDDLHKYKSRSKDTLSELEAAKQRLAEMEKNALAEKEDFKGLYESAKTELEKERDLRRQQAEYVSYNEKRRALMPELQKRNLAPEGVKMLDDLLERSRLDDLQLETTSDGRFLVEGVDTYADKLQRDYPLLFKPNAAPNVNTHLGQGDPQMPSRLTPQVVIETEMKAKRGEITVEEYQRVRSEYLKQKSGG